MKNFFGGKLFFSNKSLIVAVWLWVVLTGLVLQVWIIPSTPWHAGYGLLAGHDGVWFQDQALHLLAEIKDKGWSVWELRFQGQAPISMAAVVYALTGISKPWVLLPIHGILYAAAVWAAVSIARRIGVRERFLWLVLIPFAFPSSMLIYGQIHKDILSVPGVLLVAWSWVVVLTDEDPDVRLWLGAAMASAAGVLLAWWPRPYLVKLLTMAGFLISAIAIAAAGAGHGRRAAAGSIIVLLAMIGTSEVVLKLSMPGISDAPAMSAPAPAMSAPICDTWRPEFDIPGVGNMAASLFCYRHGFIKYYQGQSSNIDHHILLTNYGEAVRYLPRALQIGLLSPFPTHWISAGTSPGGKVKRLMSGIEMPVVYAMLLGLLWAFRSRRSKLGLAPLAVIGLVGVLFYAYLSPNVGTIYRCRFPFLILLLIPASLGWSNRSSKVDEPQCK